MILYFVAAAYYPGGSEVDRQAAGFSWTHNYWCDLLENTAENGAYNASKPIAISAMGVLCLGIILFWVFIPRLFKVHIGIKRTMQLTGIISMVTLAFLKDNNHDLIINASVLLGSVAMLLCLYSLFVAGLTGLFSLGVLCLLLCLVNTYIYYSQTWLSYLAVIQKVSFFLFLLWFCLLLLRLFRMDAAKA